MRPKLFTLIIALCFISVVPEFALVSAQVKEADERFSESSWAEYKQRKEEIEKELAGLKENGWAGDYFYGDGLGVNVHLMLAPESGFVFTWTGCMGVYDLNYGEVEWTGESVKLIFRQPNSRKGFQGIAQELIPVRWGGLHYLIPADGMIEFCNAINAGVEPPMKTTTKSGESFFFPGSRFLMRRGDEKRSIEGQPNIPVRFSDYLLKHPIKAVITVVGATRVEKEIDAQATNRYTNITLNRGRAEGVRPGMEFYVYSSEVRDSAKVVDVQEHSSEAVLEQMYFEKEAAVPAVGWKLSTYLFE